MPNKLGKRPVKHDPRTLTFGAYRDALAGLPAPPARFGHEKLVKASAWGMFGNDQYGDCVAAGAAHETELWYAETGRSVLFTTDGVLADYHAVGGPGDDGLVVLDYLNYRRHTGIRDAGNIRHQLGAFVQLRKGDFEQLVEACWLFSCVGIGIEFPSYAMDQFDAGKPWTLQRHATIEGGHYVPVVGRPTQAYVDVVTWGKKQRMSRAFYETFADEAYALLSPEELNDAGLTLEGFNLQQLNADLKALVA